MISRLFCRLLNRFAQKRPPLVAHWVEDLPSQPSKNAVYIVGGRKFPFSVAIPCPRKNCAQVIHLDIAKEYNAKEGWSVFEHEDGCISLRPSVHVTGQPCGCHYWLVKGRVIWAELPPLFVPKENQDENQKN